MDEGVKKFVESSLKRVETLLLQNEELVDKLKEQLIRHKRLNGTETRAIVGEKTNSNMN